MRDPLALNTRVWPEPCILWPRSTRTRCAPRCGVVACWSWRDCCVAIICWSDFTLDCWVQSSQLTWTGRVRPSDAALQPRTCDQRTPLWRPTPRSGRYSLQHGCRCEEPGQSPPCVFVWVRWSLIVLLVQGNFVVAARFYQTVLNMREAVFGSSHPDVARGLMNLGIVQSLQVIPSVSSVPRDPFRCC